MDDPYVYPGTDTLKNNLGITDSRVLADFERKTSSIRLNEIANKPVGGNFDQPHLQAIHRKLSLACSLRSPIIIISIAVAG